MNQNTPAGSSPSGSSYRPYYSYVSETKPEENIADKAPPASSAPVLRPVSRPVSSAPSAPAARPAPRPSAPPTPPQKKSNKGLWIVVGLVLVLFVLVSAVYIAAEGASGVGSGNKVAVIHINGYMYTGDYAYGSGIAGSDAICGHIRSAVDNNSVKAIVLRIDSPGGTGSCSQEINMEIQRARDKGIPVVTSMGDQATSAAYYVASQTDYIYASPGTTTGSIGVIGRHADNSSIYEENGVNITVFKSGEMKDMGSDYRSLTAEEKAYWQHIIDVSFNTFVNDVAEGRGMTREEVLKLADGRVYVGEDALKYGLIDDYGNLYVAADKAAELAEINSYSLYYPDNVTLSSLLF
ncbi:signal peptide peptidase SppA [Methanimicrococcus blatticola]|uniref:Signal peptide peptidase A n=1 Tax=Methanimicrococcus blatticola TaxID=91560 RepID=A0A484F4C8_9EURY|nr:signal peptide peptidase SppA [Methanimicrococcus blatticola]MBZ3935525.1 signal peptide peptidase SppA [Methanimicrococcus blatticola]MCC2509168.1 signal peptide peptidase SppA [Methanimicrococcus blatticola]TDQ69467.1 signal peptide peptidase A [Methanimicrococcus blatticola]